MRRELGDEEDGGSEYKSVYSLGRAFNEFMRVL